MPRKKKPKRRAVDARKAFLAAFAECASVSGAADAARIARDCHYGWLQKDKSGRYAAAFAAAKERAAQTLEDEAVERARIGVYEPNVYQGRFLYPQEKYEITPAIPAGDWKDLDADGNPRAETPAVMGWRDVPNALPFGMWKKSDSLLMFMLRGARPEKYRQNVEVTGKNGGPVQSTLTVRFVKPGAADA